MSLPFFLLRKCSPIDLADVTGLDEMYQFNTYSGLYRYNVPLLHFLLTVVVLEEKHQGAIVESELELCKQLT
jgi:hypothetical protein